MKKFLNREVCDPNTMTYRFKDGTGVVPEEMRQDLLTAQTVGKINGTSGVYVLAKLWEWKDRLASLSK